jgi:hypothetical protein
MGEAGGDLRPPASLPLVNPPGGRTRICAGALCGAGHVESVGPTTPDRPRRTERKTSCADTGRPPFDGVRLLLTNEVSLPLLVL